MPINIGGRIINPGDILIGDGNGLASFAQEDAEEIYQKAHNFMEKEACIIISDMQNKIFKSCCESGTIHTRRKANAQRFQDAFRQTGRCRFAARAHTD